MTNLTDDRLVHICTEGHACELKQKKKMALFKAALNGRKKMTKL